MKKKTLILCLTYSKVTIYIIYINYEWQKNFNSLPNLQ